MALALAVAALSLALAALPRAAAQELPICPTPEDPLVVTLVWAPKQRTQMQLTWLTPPAHSAAECQATCREQAVLRGKDYGWFQYCPETVICSCVEGQCSTETIKAWTMREGLTNRMGLIDAQLPAEPPVVVAPPREDPPPKVSGDPHFVGAHGVRFDFNGQLGKSYCLIADRQVHVNARMQGYAKQTPKGEKLRSWIKEIGVMWNDPSQRAHSLLLVARAGAMKASSGASASNGHLAAAVLDGRSVAVPTLPGAVVSQHGAALVYLGTAAPKWPDVDRFRLTVGDHLNVVLHVRPGHAALQRPGDSELHFDVMVQTLKASQDIHGILGQTYRNTPEQLLKTAEFTAMNLLQGHTIVADGESGEGFLDGTTADYETTSVLRADCRWSTFSAKPQAHVLVNSMAPQL